MRVSAVVLLATLAAGPTPVPDASLAVSLDARAAARGCAVVTTATIVAYDARSTGVAIAYRFVRSDGSASATRRLTMAGDGAVAQSVSDTWTPRGTAPWVALEVVEPRRARAQHAVVAPRCARGLIAASRLPR
jgi:hypothetical protein